MPGLGVSAINHYKAFEYLPFPSALVTPTRGMVRRDVQRIGLQHLPQSN